MLSLALVTVKKPNRRPDAIPVPLVPAADRARYDTVLAAAAAVEGLFPRTPAEYAEAAGVAAILEASQLWTP